MNGNATQANRRDRLGLVCFGLLASLPFLQPFHSQPIPSFHTEWLALLLGLLACGCTLPRRQDAAAIPHAVSMPLALAGVVMLQLAAGKFAYAANAALIIAYLAWGAALACAAATLASRVGLGTLIAVLAWALFISGIVSALCGFAQYYGLHRALAGWISEPMDLAHHGIYGNLSQQNHFATHLALAMGSGIYLWSTARLTRLWLYPALGLMTIALIVSGSRSAFLYLPLIAMLSGFHAHAIDRLRLPRRFGLWLACGCAALPACLWLLAHATANPQLMRLLDIAAALGPRLFLWQHAWAMFLHHPVLGVGFEGFAEALIAQIGDAHSANPWGVDQYAHDLPLQLMATSGLCGLLALALPVCLFVRRQFGLALTAERFWLWCVLSILGLHSLLEQPLYYSYFLGIAAIAAGLADTAIVTKRVGAILQAALIAGAGAALALSIKTAYDYDRLEGAIFSPRGAYLGEDARRTLLLELHASSLLSPLTEVVAPQLFAPQPATPQGNLAFNERIMHYAPTAEVAFRQAVLLADAGRADEAIAQFDRTAYAYPEQAGDYAQRFYTLGQADPSRYGALAAHVHGFMEQRQSK